jgi:hypothetical protein
MTFTVSASRPYLRMWSSARAIVHSGLHPHVVGRHQTADALLRIAEDRLGDAALGRGQQRDEPLRDLGGHLLEERGAVVGVELVDQGRHPLGAEAGDQALLAVRLEMAEDLGGEVARQQPEDEGRLVLFQPFDEVGDVGGLQFQERSAQPIEAALLEQLPDLRPYQAVERVHGLCVS